MKWYNILGMLLMASVLVTGLSSIFGFVHYPDWIFVVLCVLLALAVFLTLIQLEYPTFKAEDIEDV